VPATSRQPLSMVGAWPRPFAVGAASTRPPHRRARSRFLNTGGCLPMSPDRPGRLVGRCDGARSNDLSAYQAVGE
jgi:hypothetical protein